MRVRDAQAARVGRHGHHGGRTGAGINGHAHLAPVPHARLHVRHGQRAVLLSCRVFHRPLVWARVGTACRLTAAQVSSASRAGDRHGCCGQWSWRFRHQPAGAGGRAGLALAAARTRCGVLSFVALRPSSTRTAGAPPCRSWRSWSWLLCLSAPSVRKLRLASLLTVAGRQPSLTEFASQPRLAPLALPLTWPRQPEMLPRNCASLESGSFASSLWPISSTRLATWQAQRPGHITFCAFFAHLCVQVPFFFLVQYSVDNGLTSGEGALVSPVSPPQASGCALAPN